MPTPLRAVRIPDELWQPLLERAKNEGRDASTIIRELIRDYIDTPQGGACPD